MLHLHSSGPSDNPDEVILPSGQRITTGDHVRLRPRAGSDIFDLLLTGRAARITAIEQDFEGHQQVGVIFDDDPGRDLGMRRQPGHHFFFAPDEVELLDGTAAAGPIVSGPATPPS